MKKNEIKVGGHYRAKVSDKLVTVRVDGIEDRAMGFGKPHTAYHVFNLSTGRKTTFRSAAKFRSKVSKPKEVVGRMDVIDLDKLGSKTKPTDDQLIPFPDVVRQIEKEGEQRSDPTPNVPAPVGVPIATGLAAKLASIPVPSPDTAPHVIVEARAGTGKTTTLVESLNRLYGRPTPGFVPSPQQQAVFDVVSLSRGKVRSVCFMAFNKSIAEELNSRVPPEAEAKTLHGHGFAAVRKAFPGIDVKEDRVKTILAELTGKPIQELRKEKPVLVRAVCDLVGLCKMNLTGFFNGTTNTRPDEIKRIGTECWDEALQELADRHEVETNGPWAEVVDLVSRVLDRCRDVGKDRTIDYDDMVWLPVVLNLPVFRFDLLLIDEAQDLNRCQQELSKRSGRRLILCGDPRQAIYGFAGADSDSIPRMERELRSPDCSCRGMGVWNYPQGDTRPYQKGVRCTDCRPGVIKLPLTVTRRCGKAIVAEAKRIVPDFEAHESNGEGKVETMRYPTQPGRARGETVELKVEETYLPHVADGDMVVCRSNAPLTRQCLKFLKMGRRARIQGRNVGDNLIALIRKMDASNVPHLIARLGAWRDGEVVKEQAKASPDEGKIDRVTDRYESAMVFTEDAGTVEDVVRKIDSVFVNDPTVTTAPILLSSVHRAKGLESKRVFYLVSDVLPVRRRIPDWQRVQEDNLRYVAITRAIETLVYVH